MKIAIVTDDGATISQHFGRDTKYAVYDIQEGKVAGKELRDKPGHQPFHQSEHDHHDHGHEHGRGMDPHSIDKHTWMAAAIQDCGVLLARDMGRGAKISMEHTGIRAFQVDFERIDDAVQVLIDGSIDQHIHEQLCGEHMQSKTTSREVVFSF